MELFTKEAVSPSDPEFRFASVSSDGMIKIFSDADESSGAGDECSTIPSASDCGFGLSSFGVILAKARLTDGLPGRA